MTNFESLIPVTIRNPRTGHETIALPLEALPDGEVQIWARARATPYMR